MIGLNVLIGAIPMGFENLELDILNLDFGCNLGSGVRPHCDNTQVAIGDTDDGVEMQGV